MPLSCLHTDVHLQLMFLVSSDWTVELDACVCEFCESNCYTAHGDSEVIKVVR